MHLIFYEIFDLEVGKNVTNVKIKSSHIWAYIKEYKEQLSMTVYYVLQNIVPKNILQNTNILMSHFVEKSLGVFRGIWDNVICFIRAL